jgi:hypothetical protein
MCSLAHKKADTNYYKSDDCYKNTNTSCSQAYTIHGGLTQTIVDGTVDEKLGHVRYYTFSIPSNTFDIRLTGTYEAYSRNQLVNVYVY